MKRTTAFVVLIGVVAGGCVTGPASPIDPSTASDGPEVPAIRLESMMTGLAAPIFVAERDGLLYVAEQQGLVWTARCDGASCVRDTKPLLDVRAKVEYGGERGLVGMALEPEPSGRIYLHYSGQGDGRTVLSRFASTLEEVLLEVDQPYSNHNGGMLAFGPDGMLYMGLGDGGSADDPEERAQDKDELLGKILRFDVSGARGYKVPSDNPFVDAPGHDAVWAYGLRNPWRFSFDRGDAAGNGRGDLWIGDVGQNAFEEVNFQAAASRGGENYGWDRFEGNHHVEGSSSRSGLVFPVAEYSHDVGGCSITGGYVYRGTDVPALAGWYVYGDYCSGKLWGYGDGEVVLLADTDLSISSFGETEAGELVVVDHGGTLHQLAPA